MIAATAVAIDLSIYTCHPTDFNGIDGLEVVLFPSPPIRATPRTFERTAHGGVHSPDGPSPSYAARFV
jgi:hypothetical protein